MTSHWEAEEGDTILASRHKKNQKHTKQSWLNHLWCRLCNQSSSADFKHHEEPENLTGIIKNKLIGANKQNRNILKLWGGGTESASRKSPLSQL